VKRRPRRIRRYIKSERREERGERREALAMALGCRKTHVIPAEAGIQDALQALQKLADIGFPGSRVRWDDG
jgi:hypothetical protein